jgi:hypothetical protein
MMRRRSVSKIRQCDVTDFALLPEIGEMPERVEVAPVAVIPPMELKEIDAIHAHSRERDRDRILDGPPRYSARMRNPFCERLDSGKPLVPSQAANWRRKVPTKSPAGP